MQQLQTIEPNQLDNVTGGGIPIKPIVKGAEKAWEVAKPYAQKLGKAIDIGGTISGGVDLAKQGWDWVTGKGGDK